MIRRAASRFAGSESSSPARAQMSRRSSGPSPRSSVGSRGRPRAAATSTPTTSRAAAPSTRPGAIGAASTSAAVRSTAVTAPLATRSTSTSADATASIRALLKIPRPRTRGDCVNGPRPCPEMWCKHHLLFEVARPPKPDGRAPAPTEGAALVLNAPLAVGSRRRSYLQSNAAAVIVRVWIDDAIERWQSMIYTCSLDRADDARRLRLGRASLAELGELRGLSRAQVKRELALALRSFGRRTPSRLDGAVRAKPLAKPSPVPHAIRRVERAAPAPKVPTAEDIFTGEW